MPKVYRYDTLAELEGEASQELVVASQEAGYEGAVSAWCDGAGVWQHAAPGREPHGVELVTVVVLG